MNSSGIEEAAHGAMDLIRYLRHKGVSLWVNDGQLHYKAPRGAITRTIIERLRESRGEVVALLEKGCRTESVQQNTEPRRWRAPLAFSQLAHWNVYRLHERPSMRQIASAMCLRGRLDIDALRKSIAENVRRHDALRTRIVVFDEGPIQEIVESGACELNVVDLTSLPESCHELEVNRSIEQLIMEPIDVTVGPLVGLQLLKLDDRKYVLIIAMEHMISDGFSLGILVQDIFEGYSQALTGRGPSLPEIPIQFWAYALGQRNGLRSWIQEHGAYWKRLRTCQRLRFPEERLPAGSRFGWGRVQLRIERDLRAQLCQWCRMRRTTLVMGVFTAYVGLVLRWCDVSEGVIQYITDGRGSQRLESTIGFFSSMLYLRISVLERDSFVDLLKRVTDEYCSAYEHADACYMYAREPRPEITRNTSFNWVPRWPSVDLSQLSGSPDAIASSPILFEHPMLRNPPTLKGLESDNEPSLTLYDTDNEIMGDLCFPLNRFSHETIERFGRNFLLFIRALLAQPGERVKGVSLV